MSTATTRQIVRIDEDLCTGCGLCVSPCAEGAIEMVGGKAKVIREELCDGAGFCLGVCPTGALTIEVREAVPFDHAAAEPIIAEKQKTYIAQTCFRCGTDEDRASLVPVRQQGRSEWVCTRCLPALGVLVFVLALVALAFAFGTPQSAPDSAVTPGAPVSAASAPLAIEIPGCVCHSDDPQVVAEHAQYRMNECASCHADDVPGMGR
jgi:Fe-S-cluster-containing hydrogenase component 2